MLPGNRDSYSVFSWSRFYTYRSEMRKRFPDFWKIRIRKTLLQVVCGQIRDGDHVLDIGSFDRSYEKKLQRRFPNVLYKSMDIDRERFHDFYSFEEVREQFDVIFLFEVIEHLEFTEGINLMREVRNLLVPGGCLILTTPNMYHPNRYWEYDHKVPYRYDAIGGLLLGVGLEVKEIYRIYNDAIHRRLFRLYVTSWVHRHLQIDFAKSIVVVAKNRA
ncbi:MAG: class I SAM-dependent methyltransferase [Candidatus Tectomicrobia bacterium]|nr:class I SAM-dependent methyltransferase [Candidatus Tectomicrobia bacterium]